MPFVSLIAASAVPWTNQHSYKFTYIHESNSWKIYSVCSLLLFDLIKGFLLCRDFYKTYTYLGCSVDNVNNSM